MKHFFLTIITIVLTMSAMAQTKRVAVLETVDRENTISYGLKLMLRSNLAKAVATTEGYEAYDRTDLDAILDEQSFQRTGYVSDADIKKIGEMTGVQYVLVAEASKVDEGHIFVSAKILNVETARMEMTDNLMMKTDAESMQAASKTLASKLLIVKETPVIESTEQIVRVSKNEYKFGNQWMTRKEYYTFINNRNRCIPSYQQFQNGLKIEKIGKGFVISGSVVLFAGAMTLAIGIPASDKAADYYYNLYKKYNTESEQYYKYQNLYYKYRDGRIGSAIAGGILTGFGAIAGITGGIVWGVGVKKKDNAYQLYNAKCAEPAVTFNLHPTYDGIGLTMNF